MSAGVAEPELLSEQQQEQQLQISTPVAGSNLLAKRRSRTSSSANSLSYDLPPLSIPQPRSEHCWHCSRWAVTAKSQPIKHVQAVERDSAEIVKDSLYLMMMGRLGPEQIVQAQEMMKEAAGGQSNADPHAAQAAEAPVGTAAAGAAASPGDGSGGVSGCRGGNRHLALRLARIADEFGRSRGGRRAVDEAKGMQLPPDLVQSDFNSQMCALLADTKPLRCRIAFLMVVCAELAVRAVLLCNRAALLTVLAWCQEMFCSLASGIIVVRGWSCVLGREEPGLWSQVVVVLTLLMIGCTIGRILRRQCH